MFICLFMTVHQPAFVRRIGTPSLPSHACGETQSLSSRKHAELAEAVEAALRSLKEGPESFKQKLREQEAHEEQRAAAGPATDTPELSKGEANTHGDVGGGDEGELNGQARAANNDSVENGPGSTTGEESGGKTLVKTTIAAVASSDGAEESVAVSITDASVEGSAAAEEAEDEEADPTPPQAADGGSEQLREASPPAPAPAPDVDGDDDAAGPAPLLRRNSFMVPWEVVTSLRCLQLTMETRQSKLVDVALTCLQKLISMDYLRGECLSLTKQNDEDVRNGKITSSMKPTAGVIVEMLCFPAEHCNDEAIELQVLRCLLTAISSLSFKVHGEALLKCIRCAYNIYLSSKSVMNSNTAKATLTQIVTTIFKRMEADDDVVVVKPIVVKDVLASHAGSVGGDGYYGTAVSSEESSITLFVQSFVNRVVQDIEHAMSANQKQDMDNFLVDFGVSSPTEGGGPLHDVDEDGLRSRSLSSVDSVDAEDEIDEDVYEMAESANDGSLPETSAGVNASELGPSAAAATAHGSIDCRRRWLDNCEHPLLRRDCYLVFRTLCKLSMRQQQQQQQQLSVQQEQQQFRGKALALELIKILLTNADAVLLNNVKFVGAIKQYLCLSLLRNCTAITTAASKQQSASSSYFSGNQQAQQQAQQQAIFSQCASILVSLILKYRHHLKSEIGVFYPMVLLKLAEQHQQLAPQQQITIIKCLKVICEDKQALFDMFVNYDCDVDSSNLFERTVNVLFRLAQDRSGSGSVSSSSPASASSADGSREGFVLHFDAMRVLLILLQSLQSFASKGRQTAGGASHAQQDEEGEDESSVADEERKYKQLKDNKNLIEEGVSLFNKKPKKGLKFLIDNGKMGNGSAEEIAAFLKTTPGLNKTMIGDYLGSPEELNLAVLDAWVKELDFTGLTFDDAIRLYLRGFRLPGEAQKIDRMMEIFAHHFCKHNPGDFTSADTAYVLAYSVVMLNTDAHNDQVKVKMSKVDFLKNNRGIDDGKDLDESYLSGIYDRITTNEIKMKPELDSIGTSASAASAAAGSGALMDTIFKLFPGRKAESGYDAEAEAAILETQRELMQKSKENNQQFETASSSATVRPMLEITWAPLMAVYSVPYENSEDTTVVKVCLSAYKTVIITSGLMDMSTVRSTFLMSLAKFTSLHRPSLMREKNVLALVALLSVAEDYGDVLKGSWIPVMRCVSCFQSIAFRDEHVIHVEPAASAEGAKPVRRRSGTGGGFFGSFRSKSSASSAADSTPPKQARRTNTYVGTDGPCATAQISDMSEIPDASLLDLVEKDLITTRLFVKSQSLDAEAIIDFFKALVEVSKEELADELRPRIFSMQKLVEAAHFNMNRIRLVWSRIWSLLSDYFVFVGCHDNSQVAMMAVDSIRQLAMKFLHRDELSNFNFQNEFLKPFVVVMKDSESYDVRELIIRCIGQMVLSNVGNIKSGWKSLFNIFKTAANDKSSSIVKFAFEIIEKIVREYFQHITETETSTFTDCVECLIAFTRTNDHNTSLDDVSLNAIAFLRYCALQLAEGTIGDLEHNEGGPGEMQQPASRSTASPGDTNGLAASPKRSSTVETTWDDNELHLYFWFPLLSGLSKLTFDRREVVSISALEVLFDILQYHGNTFNAKFWKKVFNGVLFPVFDAVLLPDGAVEGAGKAEGKYETFQRCVLKTIDLFVQFFPCVRGELNAILSLLIKFVVRKETNESDEDANNSNVTLCCNGVDALEYLGKKCGPLFDDDEWGMYVDAVRAFEEYTRPSPVKIMRNALRRRGQENDADDEITEEEEGGKQARDDSVLGSSDAVVAAEAVATYVCYRRVHVALIQSTQRVFEANNSDCGTESRMGQRVKWQFISLVEGALDVVRSLAGDSAEQEAYLSLKNDDALSGLSFPPVQVETACSASLFCMLAAAIKLVDESENPEEYDKLEGRLMRLCCGCLRSYLEQSTHPVEETVSLVLTILRGVRSDFPNTTFAKYIHHIFPLLSGTRHETCSRVPRTEPITLTCVVIPYLHLPPLVRGRQHTRTHIF